MKRLTTNRHPHSRRWSVDGVGGDLVLIAVERAKFGIKGGPVPPRLSSNDVGISSHEARYIVEFDARS
jgi:hypothetical protein